MYERDDKAAARARDAIDINDFVFAATGTRVRRLTTPEGEHWFPAVDVAVSLGYANTRQALLWHVSEADHLTLGELARSVCGVDALRNVAGRGLNKTMRMVNLRGLIATIQRDGSYTLDPAPVQPAPGGGTAYLMPDEVAEAIVRLEERNIRADEAMVVARLEEIEQARRANEERGRTNDHLGSLDSRSGGLHHVLGRIADTLDLIAERLQPPAPRTEAAPAPAPPLTPQRLLATWRARNLVVTDDVHAVAVHLAPALVRGPVHCRLEEVAERTGLTLDRVHDCVRMLIKRGCVRQAGNAGDGVPVYVLP
ncbi:Bro-N domain-containing protein [Streptomyces sp. NPDC048242]|uniref:BRO-N domain-containing protein n=1 Tax=Streptomyces sp. NPDC048242 TaxID=3155026 RepID=UPI003429F6FB